jgi:type II secretory pathway component PulJ
MGELIRLEEIDREYRRSRVRLAERAHLERAVALMKQNLASAADALRHETDPGAQMEMLATVDKLSSMVRYGLRMLADGRDNRAGAAEER